LIPIIKIILRSWRIVFDKIEKPFVDLLKENQGKNNIYETLVLNVLEKQSQYKNTQLNCNNWLIYK
jgi:hypothetical protein